VPEVSLEKLEKDVLVWRRKLDDMKNKSLSKKDHLRSLQDKRNELLRE
jgi:hypothetical protein